MTPSNAGTGPVTEDGSPVRVYASLPDAGEAALVATRCPDGGSVLDLGAGTGRIADPLARHRFQVVAVDASEEMLEYVDHFVIFSGDGDFSHLVKALQRKGKKVTVASTLRTQPPMISDDLRRQADHFLELSTLADTLGRDPAQRPPRPVRELQDEDEEEYEEL